MESHCENCGVTTQKVAGRDKMAGKLICLSCGGVELAEKAERLYLVTVERLAPAYKELHIRATSTEEAERKALEMAVNVDFTGVTGEAEYTINSIRKE